MAKYLPQFDGFIMLANILVFFAQHISLWIVAPKASPSDVFYLFENRGAWQSVGASALIGLITPASALVGIDAAAHLAEEVSGLTPGQGVHQTNTLEHTVCSDLFEPNEHYTAL